MTLERSFGKREQFRQQAVGAQALEVGHGLAGEQHFYDFVEQPGWRNFAQQGHQAADRFGSFGRQFKVELVGDADGTQHAHRVFAVAQLRLADEADDLVLHVFQAAGVVHHRVVGNVVVERVDGKVAAHGVAFEVAILIVGEDAAGLVARMALGERATKSGDFDDLVTKTHMGDHEATANQPGVTEDALGLFRRGIGGHVEVLGRDAGIHIAHRATDHVGRKAGVAQTIEHFQRGIGKLTAGDRMFGAGNTTLLHAGVTSIS